MIAPLITWAGKRTICAVAGHQMIPDRFYYGPSKSMENGYCCVRCGKTQLLLYRWQSVAVDADGVGDDDG